MSFSECCCCHFALGLRQHDILRPGATYKARGAALNNASINYWRAPLKASLSADGTR